MRKIFMLIVFLNCTFFVPLKLFAKDHIDTSNNSLQIAVLNIQKLLDATGAAREAMLKIHNKYAAENKKLVKEQQNLRDDIKKFGQDKNKLKTDELEKRQQQIRAKQNELQNQLEDMQRKFTGAQNVATQELVIKFLALVSKMALKKNLDLVFFNDVVFYQNKSASHLDLTDETIKLYVNQNFKNKKST